MPEPRNFGVDNTLKLIKLLFLVLYIFEKFSLKSSFSIENLVLKMIDYDSSIQDFVQGCSWQS